ncbi:MAG TPA: VOC family protein [Armatimonadota bacterium]|jgi:PhnB protein
MPYLQKTQPLTLRAQVTPMLCASPASEAIEFYKQAFGAVEASRVEDEDGRISHAELHLGNATILLADEYPDIEVVSPRTLGGSPVMLLLEVPDVDSFFDQAVRAGARAARPLQDSFDGALRNGTLEDPYGHRWMVVTRRPS